MTLAILQSYSIVNQFSIIHENCLAAKKKRYTATRVPGEQNRCSWNRYLTEWSEQCCGMTKESADVNMVSKTF